MYELLTENEMHRRLAIGRWKISLTSLEELQVTLEVSRGAAALVLKLLQVPSTSLGKESKWSAEEIDPRKSNGGESHEISSG
jgi:hypothetical protein